MPRQKKNPDAPPSVPGMMRVEYMQLHVIARAPRNPRTHDTDAIEESFARFGYVQPVLMDEGTKTLVAGHGRLDQLETMQRDKKPPPDRIIAANGIWWVPVLRGVSFKSAREAEAYLIADNRVQELGGWDTIQLPQILKDINVEGSLAGVGFSEKEMERLIKNATKTTKPAPIVSDDDSIPDATAVTSSDLRQILILLPAAAYESAVARMRRVMKANPNIADYGMLLTFLLDFYEGANITVEAPTIGQAAEQKPAVDDDAFPTEE